MQKDYSFGIYNPIMEEVQHQQDMVLVTIRQAVKLAF